MKRLWLILFVIPLFAQSPCNDTKLIRLADIVKKSSKDTHALTNDDYFYYKENIDKCPDLYNAFKKYRRNEACTSCLSIVALVGLIGAAAYVASEAVEGSSPYDYVDYHWDQFYNQYGLLIWRCRTDGGPNSGQFALDSKCALKAKIDTRWPDKSANH